MSSPFSPAAFPLPSHFRLRVEEDAPLLRGRRPGLVPFLMEETCRAEGEAGPRPLSIELYRGAAPYLLPVLHARADAPFEDASLRALHASLVPYFTAVGYEIDPRGALRYYDAFRLEEAGEPLAAACRGARDKRAPGGVSLLLLRDESLASLPCGLTLSPPLLFARWQRRPDLPCAVAVSMEGEGENGKEGKILAAAAVGDAAADSRLREITVETAVERRGQGLGRAVTALLAEELLRLGLSPVYCCSRWNRPSRKIALSLGFRKTGRFYAISGYRI